MYWAFLLILYSLRKISETVCSLLLPKNSLILGWKILAKLMTYSYRIPAKFIICLTVCEVESNWSECFREGREIDCSDFR